MAIPGRKSKVTARLTAYPNDPRVAETNSAKAFVTIGLRPDFQAAILHRFDDPAQSPLHQTFSEIYGARKRENLTSIIKASVKPDNIVEYKNYPPVYRQVSKELTAMVKTFSAITGISDVELLVFDDLKTNPDHVHNYPALNCTWMDDGMTWKNKQGEIQQITEGDWFFFPPQFEHGSPPNPQSGRITIVVKPARTMGQFDLDYVPGT